MVEQRTDTTVAFRLPREFLKRADALIAPLGKTDLGIHGQVTRAKVLRLAVARGLETLERQHKRQKR